jgi:transposase
VVSQFRQSTGHDEKSTLLIIDAQSVKNASPAESKGYDGGKKISGIKRHLAVDSLGLPHAIAITTANVTDRNGALLALERNRNALGGVCTLLADGGYTGRPFAQGVRDILDPHVNVQIAKRSDAHVFKVIPGRWIVERSFAWLERCRRLWKNCERKLNTSLQFVNLAFLALLLRRL